MTLVELSYMNNVAKHRRLQANKCDTLFSATLKLKFKGKQLPGIVSLASILFRSLRSEFFSGKTFINRIFFINKILLPFQRREIM